MASTGRTFVLTIMAAAVMLLLTISGSSAPQRVYDQEWTSFRGNPHNQASSPRELLILEPEWEFHADGAITTSVVAAEGLGIFATSEGTVYCVVVQNGSMRWNASVGSPVYSTPSIDIDNEAVYICDRSGKVTSLDMKTGDVRWQWDTGSGQDIESSPLVADKIYFGSYDSYLYALNKNGTLAWRFEGCMGWIHTSPAFLEGMVYFGSCDGQMRALDAGTGEEIWNFSAAYIPSSPSIFDGKVFFGAYDSNMYCLDALTGALVWNTTMGNNVYSSPAVDGEYVVVGCNDGLLYCLDIDDGEIIWSLDLGPGPLESSPLISGTKAAVNYDQGLVVVHLTNGTVSQRFLLGDGANTSPSVYDDLLFWGDAHGYVYCLKGKGSGTKDNDDDGSFDLNDELDLGRDTIFFLIALVMVISTVVFIFFRKYKRMRKQE
ncbi:MAG: PQQ-binding-like beta-propeller repeat protein [Thermoplasmatota archaeon]